MECKACRKEIVGTRVEALGWAWHGGCFTCRSCERPIGGGRFVAEGDRPYHADCLARAKNQVCAACDDLITESVLGVGDKQYHPTCFRCASCDRPIAAGSRFMEHDGKPHHRLCYERFFAAGCDVCGDPLRGPYLHNGWGDRYCARHERDTAHCFSCRRPIATRLTGGGSTYADGRTICRHCRAEAVTCRHEARHLLSEVAEFFDARGLSFSDPHHLPLRLTDVNELKKRATLKRRDHPLGLTLTERTLAGNQELTARVTGIWLADGMPRDLFQVVAAHELGHAYLLEYGCRELAPREEEGMACLWEYLWLSGQPESTRRDFFLEALAKSPDGVYGDGFRAAREAHDRVGMDELLRHLKRKRRFPGPAWRRLFGA